MISCLVIDRVVGLIHRCRHRVVLVIIIRPVHDWWVRCLGAGWYRYERARECLWHHVPLLKDTGTVWELLSSRLAFTFWQSEVVHLVGALPFLMPFLSFMVFLIDSLWNFPRASPSSSHCFQWGLILIRICCCTMVEDNCSFYQATLALVLIFLKRSLKPRGPLWDHEFAGARKFRLLRTWKVFSQVFATHGTVHRPMILLLHLLLIRTLTIDDLVIMVKSLASIERGVTVINVDRRMPTAKRAHHLRLLHHIFVLIQLLLMVILLIFDAEQLSIFFMRHGTHQVHFWTQSRRPRSHFTRRIEIIRVPVR